jgi:phage baseplate assembly protein W
MLFENFDDVGTAAIAEYSLTALILKHEPRVDLTDVKIDFNRDNNSVNINIYYVIINTLEPSSVKIFLKTVR